MKNSNKRKVKMFIYIKNINLPNPHKITVDIKCIAVALQPSSIVHFQLQLTVNFTPSAAK